MLFLGLNLLFAHDFTSNINKDTKFCIKFELRFLNFCVILVGRLILHLRKAFIGDIWYMN